MGQAAEKFQVDPLGDSFFDEGLEQIVGGQLMALAHRGQEKDPGHHILVGQVDHRLPVQVFPGIEGGTLRQTAEPGEGGPGESGLEPASFQGHIAFGLQRLPGAEGQGDFQRFRLLALPHAPQDTQGTVGGKAHGKGQKPHGFWGRVLCFQTEVLRMPVLHWFH